MTDTDISSSNTFDRDMELDRLENVARDILQQAARKGGTQAEVSAHSSQGLAVTVRMGEVDILEHTRDSGIGLTVYKGRSKGHASCADLSEGSIRECVERAIDIASFTQEDSSNGLAEADQLASEFPDLDLWHPSVLDAEAAINRALEIEAAGRSDQRITNSEGASVEAGFGISVYGNSHGFIGRNSGTRYSQNCVLIAGAGENMQRDYSWDSARRLEDLEDAEKTGAEAAHRTIRRLGARKIDTAEMPVLMTPEVARGVIGHLIGAVSGSALYRNASFLKDSAGQQLFPEWLLITERPHLIRGQGSASFDSDGVATRDRNLVDAGVLTGYVLSTYSARRLGLETTANAGGMRNVTLEPGGEGSDSPIKSIDHGLLVTEVMGQGVSMVTGDYSRGAAGFVIENGELVYPVEEVTIASNLRDMFAGIRLAGADIDLRGNIRTGSILIDRMMVAGQ
ncbi:MAG TPA: metalloprotease PmbA [Xanthomonadales bacterium]|nr:metalloprotease PmbA [Xanthomonadales bacterium]